MGFTHVELLPVMEHPFTGSWGYQVTGYFAPTRRFGTPQDLMYLVDTLHQAGIGVILDWVPSHFPSDEHGLVYFDGTHLYEHADWRQGYQPDWGSCVFNYGRHEVRSFLLSSALYWLDRYHADGLRVDAVASMIYLDFSRKAGRVDPQPVRRPGEPRRDRLPAAVERGGRRESFPDAVTIAEESTSWPMVSRPTYVGGLGFSMKWDLGWMNDTLDYMKLDPIFRKFHHGKLTFRRMYAYSENFVLPLSHDEVVHLKKSLLSKMPGDDWQKLARTCACSSPTCGRSPARSSSSWAARSASGRSGTTTRASTGTCSSSRATPGCSYWVRDLNRLLCRGAGAPRARLRRRGASSGSTATTPTTASCRSSAGAKDPADRVVAVFNFTPVPALRLPRRRRRAGRTGGDRQQRRRRLRGQRRRQPAAARSRSRFRRTDARTACR